MPFLYAMIGRSMELALLGFRFFDGQASPTARHCAGAPRTLDRSTRTSSSIELVSCGESALRR